MKVIFTRDLKGQGKKGEVKEVKDGYGQNFLIKNGYAVVASSGNMTKLKNDEARRGIEESLMVHDMEDLKKELEAKTFEFNAKTGKDGKMFGQISAKQIKEKLGKD
ncbi:MAG: 50S ribosomal protein L9, partial [Firmicutes bacterium]|nr:50S ribosomal protein L9 [Bacillota bacterium]